MLLPDSLFDRFGKTFEPGQIIFCEYEPGTDFYFIQEGNVKIIKVFGSNQKTLDVLTTGDILGEMAILEQESRSASAIAVDKVRTLRFTREDFEKLLHSQPQLALKLLIIFSRRIYDAKRRLQILQLEDPQSKVADVFVMLAEKDPDFGHMQQIVIRNTVDDIANWCGLPVNDVQKVVQGFGKQGKLELYADKIILLNINDFSRLVASRKKHIW